MIEHSVEQTCRAYKDNLPPYLLMTLEERIDAIIRLIIPTIKEIINDWQIDNGQ